MTQPIGVALFGANGHQIQKLLVNHPRAKLVAFAGIDPTVLQKVGHDLQTVRQVASLDELLKQPGVEVVSLCSPKRSEQAAHALACLQAGKDVYAEKPCALTEADLDLLLETAQRTGCRFHEMAGTVFENASYFALRQRVQAGTIGQVVQVSAEKSYPWRDQRPKDDVTDGGLIRWVAVHAFRMVEHISGLRITDVQAVEAGVGNPHFPQGGGVPVSAVMMLRLQGGAVGSVTANYLNPPGTGVWGYESVRVFGTKGMIESTHQGNHTRLYVGDKDMGPVDTSTPGRDYFEFVLDELQGGSMPMSLDDELHPTRMVIRAKASIHRA